MLLTEMFDKKEYYTALAKKYDLELSDYQIRNFKFIEKIKKDCQPFLQEVSGPFDTNSLYRGIKHSGELLYKEVRLSGRTPSDMDIGIHGFLNDYFSVNFGAKFRNALFVSGSNELSSEYGDVYYVFPIGDFSFIWSHHIDDLYKHLSGLDLNDEDLLINDEYKDRIDAQLETYQSSDLAGAIESGNEIMIRSKAYYAINGEYMSADMIAAYAEILTR